MRKKYVHAVNVFSIKLIRKSCSAKMYCVILQKRGSGPKYNALTHTSYHEWGLKRDIVVDVKTSVHKDLRSECGLQDMAPVLIRNCLPPVHNPWCGVRFAEAGFQRITAQQTQVHLRLSWDSVHCSYCSNIELCGLTWALLYDPVICKR
jgi:hypothetical protein